MFTHCGVGSEVLLPGESTDTIAFFAGTRREWGAEGRRMVQGYEQLLKSENPRV